MKLDDLPKKNIYQVPDRYFDQLPGRMMARVREKESANNPVALLTFFWRQPLLRGALASLALVLSFIIFFTFHSNPSNPSSGSEAMLSSISEKEALDFLMASDQLEAQDLAGFTLAGQDLSHEFIQVSREELIQAVEQEDLEETYIY